MTYFMNYIIYPSLLKKTVVKIKFLILSPQKLVVKIKFLNSLRINRCENKVFQFFCPKNCLENKRFSFSLSHGCEKIKYYLSPPPKVVGNKWSLICLPNKRSLKIIRNLLFHPWVFRGGGGAYARYQNLKIPLKHWFLAKKAPLF